MAEPENSSSKDYGKMEALREMQLEAARLQTNVEASAIEDSDNGQNPGTSGSRDGASAARNDGSLEESTDSSKVQSVRPDGTAKGSIVPPPGSPRAVVVQDSDAEETPPKHRSFAMWVPNKVQPLLSPSGSSRVQQVRTNVPAIVPALPIAVVPALPIAGPSNAVEDPGQDRTSAGQDRTSAARAGTSAGSVNRYEWLARNSIRPYPTTPHFPPPPSQSNVQPPQPAGTTQVPQPAAVPQPVVAPQPVAVGKVCSCCSNALQRIRECFVGSCRNCCKST